MVPACGEMWIRFRLLVQLSIYVILFRSKNFLQELTERTAKYLISIRCSVYGRIKQSNLPISRKISSLLCNCDGGVRFGAVSVSPVPAENRLISGFFARKALRDGLF